MDVLDELFCGEDARAERVLRQVTAAHRPALEERLRAESADIRWWAVCALAQLSGPETLTALQSAAVDPDPSVRAAGLHALGGQEAPEAVLLLLFALADPSPYLARLATDALIRTGAPAVPGLLQALEHDVQPAVRVCAARALALIGDQAAIPGLFRALEDESALVRHWAEEGLERMGAGQVYFMP